MKKIEKKSVLLGFILGVIIFGGIGVVAATIWAADITYTKEDNTQKTVQDAIDELYNMANGAANKPNATGATINATPIDEDGNLVGKTYYAEVYLDPTDLTRECNATNSAINIGKTNQKTGCMKWYAYAMRANGSKTEYDLILDHNSTALVPWANQSDYLTTGGTSSNWNLDKYNTQGPVTVVKELVLLTADTTSGGYGWKVKPRMITADEIAHIVGADREDTIKWKSTNPWGIDVANNQSTIFYLDGGRNENTTGYINGWQTEFATSKGTSNYAWLYDYTNGCENYGCNNEDSSTYIAASNSPFSIDGYWTITKIAYHDNIVWMVNYDGQVDQEVTYWETVGLRPVITIVK